MRASSDERRKRERQRRPPRRRMTNGLVIGCSRTIGRRINELRDPSNQYLTTRRRVIFKPYESQRPRAL